VAVSEGIAGRGGKPVAVELAERLGHRVERDTHGNVQLSGTGVLGDFLSEYIKDKLQSKARGAPKLRVRADTYGYLQRSFAGYASPVDQAEARLAGQTAVRLAMSGDIDGSVVFKRKKTRKYAVECVRAELSQVARETKHMPRNYINKAGNDVTKAFLDYARPLVGELPELGQLG